MERKDQTCYISIDDIGVKHQKEHRIGNDEKNGVYVWNTVAHIEAENVSHTVTGVGMKKTFMFVLAYLLKRNLLAGKTLVFFTDGAKSIFANIDDIFSFHPFTVVLDWFHLKKRCQEYLSMSIKRRMAWAIRLLFYSVPAMTMIPSTPFLCSAKSISRGAISSAIRPMVPRQSEITLIHTMLLIRFRREAMLTTRGL